MCGEGRDRRQPSGSDDEASPARGCRSAPRSAGLPHHHGPGSQRPNADGVQLGRQQDDQKTKGAGSSQDAKKQRDRRMPTEPLDSSSVSNSNDKARTTAAADFGSIAFRYILSDNV